MYPLEENNLHDHIISSNTTTVLPRKRKRVECESALPLLPSETTSPLYNNTSVTHAELEDINTCAQLNKKARLSDTALEWGDVLVTRVNDGSDAHSLLEDTSALERGEMSFDLSHVT